MNVHTENEILIHAPLEKVFQTTANLLLWPQVLSHYRWVRILRPAEDGFLVKMAAWRGWLPIQWTSRFHVDGVAHELRFQHLKAFTRGMKVKWTYTPTDHGVRVRISHEMERRSMFGRWFASRILGNLFICPVAARTLAEFKRHLEADGA